MLVCLLQAPKASVNKQMENMNDLAFMAVAFLSGKNKKTIALIDKMVRFSENRQKADGLKAARKMDSNGQIRITKQMQIDLSL